MCQQGAKPSIRSLLGINNHVFTQMLPTLNLKPSMQAARAWRDIEESRPAPLRFAHYREDFVQCVRRRIGARIRLTDRGQIVKHKKKQK